MLLFDYPYMLVALLENIKSTSISNNSGIFEILSYLERHYLKRLVPTDVSFRCSRMAPHTGLTGLPSLDGPIAY